MNSTNRPKEEQVFKFKTMSFELPNAQQCEIVIKQVKQINFTDISQ